MVLPQSPLKQACDRLSKNDPSLTMVNLSNQEIGNWGLGRLEQSAKNNSHLLVLWLDNNGITRSLKDLPKTLEFLYCSRNPHIKDPAMPILTLPKLQALKLANNEITSTLDIAHALKTTSHLQSLSLRGNPLGNDEIARLAYDGLAHNTTLKSLDLSDTDLTREGLVALRNVLRDSNQTLCELLLDSSNDVDDVVEEIHFYLQLNKLGRHSLGHVDIPASLWPRILTSHKNQPKLLHFMLQNRPDLIPTASTQV